MQITVLLLKQEQLWILLIISTFQVSFIWRFDIAMWQKSTQKRVWPFDKQLKVESSSFTQTSPNSVQSEISKKAKRNKHKTHWTNRSTEALWVFVWDGFMRISPGLLIVIVHSLYHPPSNLKLSPSMFQKQGSKKIETDPRYRKIRIWKDFRIRYGCTWGSGGTGTFQGSVRVKP